MRHEPQHHHERPGMKPGVHCFIKKRGRKKGDAFISSSSASYLNQSVTTSSTGEAAYNLADGSYRVTANYLGYEYSTDPFTVPLITSQTLAIPHQAHTVSVVRSYQNNRVALANIEATLCTVDGTPLALTATTGADGTLQWSLPSQAYAVQARYLGRTYLSEPFTSGNPTVLIPEGLARVTLLQGGAALPNTQVVAISDSDPDHPQNLTSDASGVAELRLPAGSYTFKATLGETVYQGIGTVLADQTTNVTLNLGASTLSIAVRTNETTVLPGVVCSLYTAEGEPLNRSATTDGSGVASFAVEAGTYRVKAWHLGYDFTSEVIETPAVLSASLTIPHRDLAVRVLKDQGQGAEPVSGLRCYLYTLGEGEGLNATGLYADSDDQGMVHFVVPEERAYYAVTTLLGREFISVESEGQATLTIELGTMTVTVRDDSAVTETNPDGLVQGAVVTLYTSEGTALGQELSTGADGQVCFTLPEGSYKLRVGYNDQQFWSGVIGTYPLGDTPVEMVNGSGGILSRLHDPHPSLWHGTPPEYRPLLALASGSLAGMLNTTSTPVTATPQVYYYLNDHLGTAQLLVDATGIVIWQGDAQPFGQVTEVINQIDHRFRFPGQMLDPESGLHYNWNRFYDPETGRYISADPIGLAGGINLYAYVEGNPINAIDIYGLRDYVTTYNLYSVNVVGFQGGYIEGVVASKDKNPDGTYDATRFSGWLYGTGYGLDYLPVSYTEMNQEECSDSTYYGLPNVQGIAGKIQIGGGNLAVGNSPNNTSGGYFFSGDMRGTNESPSHVKGLDISVSIMEGNVKTGRTFQVTDPYLGTR